MLRRGLVAFLVLFAAGLCSCAAQGRRASEPEDIRYVFPNEIDRFVLANLEERTRRDYRKGACRLPRAEPGEIIAVYGALTGGYLSTAALNGQDDETHFGFIDIAPGDRPLYLILTSDRATIWQFRGAVERIAKLTLVGPSAIVGPAPPVFGTLEASGCFGPFNVQSGEEAVKARAIIRTELGRRPDMLLGRSETDGRGALVLPSAPVGPVSAQTPDGLEHAPTPAGFDPESWYRISAGYRGIVDVDPKLVVGAAAESYEVLGGWAGISQLAGAGALAPMPYANDGWTNYRIVRSIPRFPGGLASESIRFYLAVGIPFPQGDPRGSCVIDESTGQATGPSAQFCIAHSEFMRRNIEENARRRASQN